MGSKTAPRATADRLVIVAVFAIGVVLTANLPDGVQPAFLLVIAGGIAVGVEVLDRSLSDDTVQEADNGE